MAERNYNGALKSLKIISEIILVLLAVGMTFAVLREKVRTNRKDIDVNTISIEGIKGDTGSMKIDMREMTVRQEVISDDIKDIRDGLKK